MILKKGSKGALVVALQEFLGISPDGDFGHKTEMAVKKWQGNNGLTQDGVVGTKTWAAMGIASTDISETHVSLSTTLDINENHLPTGEYFSGPTKKEWLFLHHTAGWNNPFNVVRDWGLDSRGSVGTEFVLGGMSVKNDDNKYDGTVVQAIPEGGYGWHLGTGNEPMHRNSVGIEICNFGQLTKGGYHKSINGRREWIPKQNDKYYTYVGTEADPGQVAELATPFRNFRHYHRYSDTQILVLKELILYIAERDTIDIRKGLPELVHQHGSAAFGMFDPGKARSTKGLWSHTNVRNDKFDVFPQPELVEMLRGL
jgi:hypothetical protein